METDFKVPEGYWLMPLEPTEEILDKIQWRLDDVMFAVGRHPYAIAQYQAVLRAAGAPIPRYTAKQDKEKKDGKVQKKAGNR